MNDLDTLLRRIRELGFLAAKVASGPLTDQQIKDTIKARFGRVAAMRLETIRRIRQAVMAVF